jgi:hypothetical protein
MASTRNIFLTTIGFGAVATCIALVHLSKAEAQVAAACLEGFICKYLT